MMLPSAAEASTSWPMRTCPCRRASHAPEACAAVDAPRGRAGAAAAPARRGLGAVPTRAEPSAAGRRTAGRRTLGHGHRRPRRPRRADRQRRHQAGRGAGPRLRPRAGSLLPDGPRATPVGGRALGADRSGHACRLDAQTRVAGVPSARAAGHRAGDRRRARAAGRLRGGRQRRPRGPWGRSPEYLALRTTPEPWKAEDCVLVLASMFLQLQDAFGVRETRIGLVYDVLPRPLAEFVTTTASDWETPLSGPARPAPEVPGADVFDLRGTRGPAAARRHLPPTDSEPHAGSIADDAAVMAVLGVAGPDRFGVWGSDATPGSNNWALSGAHTASRGAIVADDMHLGLGVPNIWYRASLAWTTPVGAPRDRRDAARRADAGRRQQRAHRVGLHQHDRRLDGHRVAGRRSGQPLHVPHAGGMAALRHAQGADRGHPRDAERRSRSARPSGGPCSNPTREGASAPSPGCR